MSSIFQAKPAVILLVLQLFLAALTVEAEEPKKRSLVVGYIKSQLVGINPLDAEAAFKTLSRTLGVINGYDVESSIQSFEDEEDFVASIANTPVHIAILDSWTYLKIEEKKILEPMFVPTLNDEEELRYLILTGKTEIRDLSSLQGKSLSILYDLDNTMEKKWLDTILEKQGLPGSDSFFGSLDFKENPMQTILPVFFGKQDAALMDTIRFSLMTELNPQLNKLRPLFTSPSFVNGLICIATTTGWQPLEFRDVMIKTLAGLHKYPAGQQILALYQTGKLEKFEPKHLENVRRIYKAMEPTSQNSRAIAGGRTP